MPRYGARSKMLGFASESLSPWMAALGAAVAGGLLTTAVAMTAHGLSQQQLHQRFDLLANERHSQVAERLARQAVSLDSLRGFLSYLDVGDLDTFAGFVRGSLHTGFAYGWAPRVESAQRLEVPAPARSRHYPVQYVEPAGAQASLVGRDLRGIETVATALGQAEATAGPAVAAPLTFTGAEQGATLMLLAPVMPATSGAAPRAGYVFALANLAELMGNRFPGGADEDLALRLYDVSNGAVGQALYVSPNTPATLDLSSRRLLPVANRQYELVIRPSLVFLRHNRSALVAITSVLGGLLSLLAGGLLYRLLSQRQRALGVIAQRTAELQLSEQALRDADHRLRSVLDAATQVAIIATTLKGVVSTFNAGAERMLGYSAGEAVGCLTLGDLVEPQELERRARILSLRYGRQIAPGQAMFAETAQRAGGEPGEWTLVRKDGSRLLANMLVTAVFDEQGLWSGHLAICIDVTERRRSHEALAERDRLLEKLSAQVPGGIYQFRRFPDGSCCFSYASEGLRDIYEIEPRLLREDGSAVFERIHPDDQARVAASIVQSARDLAPWREEYRVLLPESGTRWVRGEATPERVEGGGTLWHGYLSDISDLKRVEEELRTLSITDALTGVYNRRYFEQRIEHELERARRDGLDLAVIMLDVDHFKRINDRFGHAAGDQVLLSLCQSIGARLRRSDVFCRLGGEEFIVLCPGSSAEQARCLALQLWQGVRGAAVEGVGQVTASFGVVGWRLGEGIDSLLLRADALVYAAKQAGRDRVEVEPA